MLFNVTTQSKKTRNILQICDLNKMTSENPIIGITPSLYNSSVNPFNNSLFIATPYDVATAGNKMIYHTPFATNNRMLLNTTYFLCLVLDSNKTKVYWGSGKDKTTKQLSIDVSGMIWNWGSDSIFYTGAPWYINDDNGIYIKNLNITNYSYNNKKNVDELFNNVSQFLNPVPKAIVSAAPSIWILPESISTALPMISETQYTYGNLFFTIDEYIPFSGDCTYLSFSFVLSVKTLPRKGSAYNIFCLRKSATDPTPTFSLSLFNDPNNFNKNNSTFFDLYYNVKTGDSVDVEFPSSGYTSIAPLTYLFVTVSIDFSGNTIYYSLGGSSATISPDSQLIGCNGASSVFFGDIKLNSTGEPVTLDGSQLTVQDFTIYNNYLLKDTDISGMNQAYIAVTPTAAASSTPTITQAPRETLTIAPITTVPTSTIKYTIGPTPIETKGRSSGDIVSTPSYTGPSPSNNLNVLTTPCNPFGCYGGTPTNTPGNTPGTTRAPREKHNWWETQLQLLEGKATLSPDTPPPSDLTDRQCDYMFNKYFNNDNKLNRAALIYYENYIIANGAAPAKTSLQEYIREMVRSFWYDIGYDVFISKNSYYDPRLPDICKTVHFTSEMVKNYNKINEKRGIFFTDISSAQYNWENYGCLQNPPLKYEYSSDDLVGGANINKNVINPMTHITDITNFAYLIGQTHNQNVLLQSQITQNAQANLSYDTVSTYNQNKYETLAYYNNVLFWTYYVFWALLMLALFVFGSAYSLTASLLFAIIFAIYPLVSNLCIHWTKYIYNYLAAFIFNWVFNGSNNVAQTHPIIGDGPKPTKTMEPTLPQCVMPTVTATLPAHKTILKPISTTNPTTTGK